MSVPRVVVRTMVVSSKLSTRLLCPYIITSFFTDSPLFASARR